MRKTTLFICLIFWIPVYATFVGNPSSPAILEEGFFIPDRCWSNIRAGLIADFLFEKRLCPCGVSKHRGIHRPYMRGSTIVGLMGWNIRERFDLQLLVGPILRECQKWQQEGVAYRAKSHSGLWGGARANLILLEIRDTTLGVNGQVGGTDWMKGSLTQSKADLHQPCTNRFYFWQIAAGLSQQMVLFRPYAGGVVNHTISIIRSRAVPKHKIRLCDLVQTGLYEGCTFNLGTRIFLNVEARQFCETSFTASFEARF